MDYIKVKLSYHGSDDGNVIYDFKDMVKEFEKQSGQTIAYKFVPRREGDVAACYADPKLASEALGWKAEKGLADMCRDSWNWQSNNPNGYNTNPH